MNKEEALVFLKQYQPLPDDKDLTQEIIDKYDEIRKFFLKNPDKDCIPLFLNSFGSGDGLGVYQLVGDVLCKFNKSDVIPHLQESLLSSKGGIGYWNTQIAAIFPDKKLIPQLAQLLTHKSFDMRYATITALEQIGGTEVRKLLADQFEAEDDDEIKELLEEILKG